MANDAVVGEHGTPPGIDGESRQSFLLRFSDRINSLTDAEEIRRVSVSMLREWFGVANVNYPQLSGEQVVVFSNARVGCGISSGNAGGCDVCLVDVPSLVEVLRSNLALEVSDVASDPRVASEDKQCFAKSGIRSFVAVPLVIEGELKSILTIHGSLPRGWRKEDVMLVEDVVQRSWESTERARARSSLGAREERLSFLLRLNDALRPLTSAAAIKEIATRLLGEKLGASGALYVDVIDGTWADVTHWRVPGGPSMAGRVRIEDIGLRPIDIFRRGQALVVEDVESDQRFSKSERDALLGIEVRATASVGIVKGSRLVEALSVHSTSARSWSDADIQVLRETGERIWEALGRVRAELALSDLNRSLEARVASLALQLDQERHLHKESREARAQSRRMEALGQLTSGIAHDFNNLLTIISGNLELAEAKITDQAVKQNVRKAIDAIAMGSNLNRRLLSFARKQKVAAERVDLNVRIKNVSELLRQSLGDEFELETRLDDSLWPVFADPGEVDSSIINIAVNARDAMPNGGQLAIVTGNTLIDGTKARETGVKPGDYASLVITDTGCGMSPEVLRRAVEPLFTTKTSGRGSGLGLSSVYGFARQSGGFMELSSKAGHGTTVRLCLPRATDDVTVAAPTTVVQELPRGDAELILVVEDNDDVRHTMLARLEGLGYTVLEARNGPKALEILKQEKEVALVLSDVRMRGGMSGYELARRIRAERSDLRVLLMSGQNDLNPEHHDDLSLCVLAKPHSRVELAQAVHEALA